jgi:hypothetical protein
LQNLTRPLLFNLRQSPRALSLLFDLFQLQPGLQVTLLRRRVSRKFTLLDRHLRLPFDLISTQRFLRLLIGFLNLLQLSVDLLHARLDFRWNITLVHIVLQLWRQHFL